MYVNYLFLQGIILTEQVILNSVRSMIIKNEVRKLEKGVVVVSLKVQF